MGKKRRSRRGVRWRMDQDYLDKLSPEEREWLDKFNDEYYRCEFTDDPIHDVTDKKVREDLYDAQNSSNRDLVTAHPEDVKRQCKLIYDAHTKKNISQHRYLDPSTYAEDSCRTPEDLLVEVLDLTEAQKPR